MTAPNGRRPEIPRHWTWQKVKHLAVLKSGEAITSESILGSGDYPVYGGNGLRGFTSRFTHSGDFILIGRQGALCGNINYASGEFWASEHAIVVNPRDKLPVRWLGEVLRWMNLNQLSVSAAQPGLSVQVIGNQELPVPTPAERCAIADFLDRETARIDELIAQKEKLLQLTEERKHAEVTQRVMRGLTPGVLLRDTAADYLGRIPAHWTTPPIYARYSVALGKMLDARQITGAFLLPYLRNVDVQWDRINTDDLPQMDISPEEYDRFLLRKGDLLVCEGGEVGRCSIWTGDLSPCAYQKALHRMRPLRSDEHVRYMFYTLAHVAASGYFAASGSPNTIPHLTAEKLRVFRFPKPSLDEQIQISAHLDAYIASLRQTEGAIQRAVGLLKEHRTALISAAVTGQIDVRTYRNEPKTVLEAT